MNAYYLKWLAVILMVVDHIGYFLFPELKILRMIGRLSFPIFGFLIANGYHYTKDVKKYFLRLFVFANVIQLPALFMSLPVNIFYTLSLGLLCIIVFDSMLSDVNKLLSISGLVIIAYLIKCDYGPYGVLLILLIYVLRKRYFLMAVGIFILSAAFYGLFHIQGLATISVLFFVLYNEQQGRKMKYFFYLFYPIHMAVLYYIADIIR